MKLTLGMNIASLKAQRHLAKSQDTLSTVFERLSSGQRINRASDDAAGLAIADSLRADARTFGAAIRNINDGVSLLNIMDSALESQSQILIRMKELAQQSANGVYNDTQREALDLEYQALVQEFGRIGDSAEFNGISLLDSEQAFSLQVGISSDANSQISITTDDFGAASGVLAFGGDYNGDGRVSPGDLGILGSLIGANPQKEDFFEVFGQSYQQVNVLDSGGNERTVYLVGAVAGYNFSGDPGDSEGNLYVMYENADGEILLGGQADLTASLEPDVALTFAEYSTTGTLSVDLSTYEHLPLATYGENHTALEFSGVETEARALFSLDVVERRLEDVTTKRGEIGASMSRLDVALNVAQSTRENYLAAESRIRDADVAQEAAKLTQTQILQQVGAAILAQANQQPQITLQLLQGL